MEVTPNSEIPSISITPKSSFMTFLYFEISLPEYGNIYEYTIAFGIYEFLIKIQLIISYIINEKCYTGC